MIPLDSFVDEIAKIADVSFRDSKDAPLVAAGLFVGLGSADSKGSQIASQKIHRYLQEERSFQKAKARYQKENPNHFVTAAFKFEKEPEGLSIVNKIKRVFGSSDAAKEQELSESRVKSWEDRKKKPRVFIRSGQSGGHHQSAFYKEVARGLYDSELNQPHLSKKDRVVYT